MVGSSHTANSKIRVVVMILFGTIEIWGIFVLPRSNINNRHVHTMYGVPQVRSRLLPIGGLGGRHDFKNWETHGPC